MAGKKSSHEQTTLRLCAAKAKPAPPMLCKVRISYLLLCAFLVVAQGCGDDKTDFKPLSGGFLLRTQWVGIDSGPGAEIQYKGDNSKRVVIWPFVTGGLAFTNDIIFFRGDMPDDQGRLGSYTFFAAQAPGPALVVSKDLLKLWTEANKLDFKKMKGHYFPGDDIATTNGIQLHFLRDENFPEARFEVSWEQLAKIIQDVKKTGNRHVLTYSPQKTKVAYIIKEATGDQ